ncbi:MAG: NADP-dependent isocitrate dehydrogenase, partial [Acidobacteriota bacterium]|nr:NADP-dependent isocitrate dehydrogenase [Acidobacteriota bacterium]
HERDALPGALAARLGSMVGPDLSLQLITNRGVKVWPHGHPETFCTDHWRCRFVARDDQPLSSADVVALLERLSFYQVDFVKTEHLYTFDGQPGYSLGQGQ